MIKESSFGEISITGNIVLNLTNKPWSVSQQNNIKCFYNLYLGSTPAKFDVY